MPQGLIAPIRLVCCYAEQDEKSRGAFVRHLTPLVQRNLIALHQPLPGDKLSTDEQLTEADMIVCLVSSYFFISPRYQELQLRAQARPLRLVPVLVSSCDWQDTDLAKLKPLPANNKPIHTWENREEAWSEVVEALREIVEKAKSLPAGPSVAPVAVHAQEEPRKLVPVLAASLGLLLTVAGGAYQGVTRQAAAKPTPVVPPTHVVQPTPVVQPTQCPAEQRYRSSTGECVLKFQWVQSKPGSALPQNAITADPDDPSSSVVCAAKHDGDSSGPHAGRLHMGGCRISLHNGVFTEKDYKILVGPQPSLWTHISDGRVSSGAVQAGIEKGQPLKVCRAVIDGRRIPGKVINFFMNENPDPSVPNRNQCAFAHRGIEMFSDQFDVLLPES